VLTPHAFHVNVGGMAIKTIHSVTRVKRIATENETELRNAGYKTKVYERHLKVAGLNCPIWVVVKIDEGLQELMERNRQEC